MNFNLKRPCKDCPFVEGGVQLSQGRFEEIVGGLLEDDRSQFYCHKTIDYGRMDEETGEMDYSGDETVCMGSLAYVRRHHGTLPVTARLALSMKILKLEDLEASEQLVKEK